MQEALDDYFIIVSSLFSKRCREKIDRPAVGKIEGRSARAASFQFRGSRRGFMVGKKYAGAVREQKSMAVRLTLNSDEATLTESQIELAVQAVLASLQQRLGARQR